VKDLNKAALYLAKRRREVRLSMEVKSHSIFQRALKRERRLSRQPMSTGTPAESFEEEEQLPAEEFEQPSQELTATSQRTKTRSCAQPVRTVGSRGRTEDKT
jgi:hypothetical protein